MLCNEHHAHPFTIVGNNTAQCVVVLVETMNCPGSSSGARRVMAATQSVTLCQVVQLLPRLLEQMIHLHFHE